MNKNIKTEFLMDKFTDFTGKEREFIIAAVSVPLCNQAMMQITDLEIEDDKVKTTNFWFRNVTNEKLLLLGMSIRDNNDVYNEELGKRIAIGKALKFKGKVIAVSDAGLVNTKVVKALLEQEAEYFKRDPQSYITGYNNAKKRWSESKKTV